MANPRPVHTLTRWKVLDDEEVSDLIDTGQLQKEVTAPPGVASLTNKQVEDLKRGQPLFVVWHGDYFMLSWKDDKIIAYGVKPYRK